jgi:lipopolysaccharide export system permease protein
MQARAVTDQHKIGTSFVKPPLWRQYLTIIDRHLGQTTVMGFLLVLVVLLTLFSFIELLGQINDIGKGGYQIADAFIYVALTIPRRAVELMPVSMLLGSIVALGMLADHNELLAMQAGGVSVRRICAAVLGAGVLMMVFSLALAEFVSPPMDQHARILRSKAMYGKGVMLSQKGFWIRSGEDFVHVGRSLGRFKAADVEVIELDGTGNLKRYIYARNADFSSGDQWQLSTIIERVITDQGIQSRQLERLSIAAPIDPEQIGILELPPDSLSLTDLAGYIAGLRQRGQNADRHALALWQKLTLPVVNGVMVLLALTFIFGPTRSRSAGQRIFLGTIVGILFYLANQICGHLGLIWNIHPALTTLAPVAGVLWIALTLLRRVR